MKKPSQTLIRAAKAVIMTQAMVNALRPKIEKLQDDLLSDFNIINTETNELCTSKTMYLMSDKDAEMFYPELDKEYRKAGYTNIEKGQSPLLIAETLQRRAERLFMEATIEIARNATITPEMIEKVITCELPNGIALRKEYLDINMRYVAGFISKQAMSRYV